MYLYEIGWYNYEERYTVTLTHVKKFSNEEFQKFILDTLPEIIQKNRYEPDFSEIYEEISKVLCRDHGFIIPEYCSRALVNSSIQLDKPLLNPEEVKNKLLIELVNRYIEELNKLKKEGEK